MLDTLDFIDYDNYMTNAEIEETMPIDPQTMTDEEWSEWDRFIATA